MTIQRTFTAFPSAGNNLAGLQVGPLQPTFSLFLAISVPLIRSHCFIRQSQDSDCQHRGRAARGDTATVKRMSV
ncbi:predicted protein [Plenodomus lingam JN3]|uniref:Predicted protein n=2 Tax=Leptosphaeria maculans TaxID=5022 RepID=E5A4A4_LEPMJ|nr:predicted protein [Plenodomus lingam JN3]CBX98449.1 predicted protein [Plenodomus lingam JN3]